MAEPAKKDDALAIAVREAFQRHMENARLAALVNPPPEAAARAIEAKPVQPEKPTDIGIPEAAKAKSSARARAGKAVEPKPPVPESKSRESRLDVPVAANRPAEALAPVALPAPIQEPVERLPAPRIAATVPVRRDPLPIVPREPRRPTPPPGDRVAEEIVARREAEWLQARSAERAAQQAPRPVPVERQARELVQRQRERLPAAPLPEDLDARTPLPQSGRDPVGRTRPQSHFGTQKADDAPIAGKTRRPSRPANANAAPQFGAGKRSTGASILRWALPTIGVIAVLGGISTGVYLWVSHRPLAVDSAPGPIVNASSTTAPVATTPAATPSVQAATPPAGDVPTHAVKTTTITLDEIDMAVQEAREKAAYGDVDGARKALEPYRAVGDARALVALAETYDPSLVHNPALADAKQAQQLYEAAGKAGFQGSADRLAKLQQAQIPN